MLGGGWDTLTVNGGFPTQKPCSIAVGLSVPWNETNQRHNVAVEITDQDGNVAATMNGQLEVGRPPGLPIGQSQLVVLALDAVMGVEKPGTFVIVAKLEDQESKRVTFRVVAGYPVAAT
jgi:hypothetical protein